MTTYAASTLPATFASSALFAFCLAGLLGCSHHTRVAQLQAPEQSKRTVRARSNSELLAIAKRSDLTIKARTDAVWELGQSRDTSAVPELLALLTSPSQGPNYLMSPGDQLNYALIQALRLIGDPAALPRLQEMQNTPGRKSCPVDFALRSAIPVLEQNSRATDR